MQVTAIIASYQGIVDGVVYAGTDFDEVQGKLCALIRNQVIQMYGKEAQDWGEDDVLDKYDEAIDNCAKVTEYTLDEFEVHS